MGLFHIASICPTSMLIIVNIVARYTFWLLRICIHSHSVDWHTTFVHTSVDQPFPVSVFQILQCLTKIYLGSEDRDFPSICQCLMFLNGPEVVATILDGLLIASEV